MNSVFPPVPPPLPAPVKKRFSWPVIVALVAGAFVVMIAVLAALALPTFNKVREKAMQIKARREAATKKPEPLTEEQKKLLLTFGEKLAALLTEGDATGVGGLFDAELMTARVFSEFKESLFIQGARKGFVESVNKRDGGAFSMILGQRTKCLRVRERDGFPAVLLRTLPSDGGVAYLDAIVIPKDGSFRVVDGYNYVFAQYISAEARNAMMAMMPSSEGMSLRELVGVPKIDNDLMEKFHSIFTAMQQGQDEKVVQLCDRMSPELRKSRTLFTVRLKSLMSLQTNPRYEKLYLEALEDASAILGNDSATDLLMVDKQILNRDFEGAMNSFTRLDQVVGGDPYLNVLRANIRIKMNDLDGADALRLKTQKEEPDLLELVDLRLTIFAMRKDYAALVEELRAFKKERGVILGSKELAEPVYKAFLESKEFAGWQKETGR